MLSLHIVDGDPSPVQLVQSTMPHQAIRTRKLLAAFRTLVRSFFRVTAFMPSKVFRLLKRGIAKRTLVFVDPSVDDGLWQLARLFG